MSNEFQHELPPEADTIEEFEQYYKEIRTTFCYIAFVSICIISFHFDSLEEAANVLFIALSCFAGAGLIGFLFGLPSTKQKSNLEGYYIEANNSFDKISDWLTKIIVGLTLFQWSDIYKSLTDLANTFSNGLPGLHYGYAVGVIGFYLPFGFLFGYIMTRCVLTIAISEADRSIMSENLGKRIKNVQRAMDQHCRIDLYLDACKRKWQDDKVEQAWPLLNYVLRLDPDNEPALIEKARLHFEAKEFDKAEDTLKNVLDINPSSPMAHYDYGRYVIRRHYEKSRGVIHRMPEPEVQKVIKHWQKAFDQIPELKYFAANDSEVNEYLLKEPEINERVHAPDLKMPFY